MSTMRVDKVPTTEEGRAVVLGLSDCNHAVAICAVPVLWMAWWWRWNDDR